MENRSILPSLDFPGSPSKISVISSASPSPSPVSCRHIIPEAFASIQGRSIDTRPPMIYDSDGTARSIHLEFFGGGGSTPRTSANLLYHSILLLFLRHEKILIRSIDFFFFYALIVPTINFMIMERFEYIYVYINNSTVSLYFFLFFLLRTHRSHNKFDDYGMIRIYIFIQQGNSATLPCTRRY